MFTNRNIFSTKLPFVSRTSSSISLFSNNNKHKLASASFLSNIPTSGATPHTSTFSSFSAAIVDDNENDIADSTNNKKMNGDDNNDSINHYYLLNANQYLNEIQEQLTLLVDNTNDSGDNDKYGLV